MPDTSHRDVDDHARTSGVKDVDDQLRGRRDRSSAFGQTSGSDNLRPKA